MKRFYRLLPNKQLLVHWKSTVKLFDLSAMHSIDSRQILPIDKKLMPFWVDDPAIVLSTPTVVSKPALHSASSSVRIAYSFGTGIYGISAPLRGRGVPQYIKLSDTILPRGSSLSVDKFVYPNAPDHIARGSFTWPSGIQWTTEEQRTFGDSPPIHQKGIISACDAFDDASTAVLIVANSDWLGILHCS